MRLALVLALLATTSLADELPPLVAAPPAAADTSDRGRLSAALERFEFGDYEKVVDELAALVDSGALSRQSEGSGLSRADRLEALRAYAIACALVGRPTPAEGAFSLLLEADPSARLDPAFVRPEAVAIFERVRARRRDEALAIYRKSRGRRYVVLNFLPPAGQLQNREYAKGYSLLGVELALLALDITTTSLLYSWRGPHQDFPGHEDAAASLRPVNWVSFGALLVVLGYGVIDGLVVGHRRALEERAVEDRYRSGDRASLRVRIARTLDLTNGVGLHF